MLQVYDVEVCEVVILHCKFFARVQFAICPVRHWKRQLNGPGGFFSGPVQGPYQAPQVKCRALSPDREELMAYETSMYCSDADSSEERACITRMISHMHP